MHNPVWHKPSWKYWWRTLKAMAITACWACCFGHIRSEKSGVRPSALCQHNLSPNLTPASEQRWSTQFKIVEWGYCEYSSSSISLFLPILVSTYSFLGFFCNRILHIPAKIPGCLSFHLRLPYHPCSWSCTTTPPTAGRTPIMTSQYQCPAG